MELTNLVKLEQKYPTLNATVIGNEFKGKATFTLVNVSVGDFFDKGIEQVKFILAHKANAYSLVLNASNTDFINKKMQEYDLEPDSDNIPLLTKFTIESYDTGSKGVYKYGVRIIEMELPTEQETLKPKSK